MLRAFWNDEAGAIISAELTIVMTILVIGLVAGLTEVRNAVSSEMADISGALRGLNQTYATQPIIGNGSMVGASGFRDNVILYDGRNNVPLNDLEVIDEGNPTCLLNASLGGPMIENNIYVNNTTR